MSLSEELDRLARLHRDGDLDDQEFARAKRHLLGAPTDASPASPVPAADRASSARPSPDRTAHLPGDTASPSPSRAASRGSSRDESQAVADARVPYAPRGIRALADWLIGMLWLYNAIAAVLGVLLAIAYFRNVTWEAGGGDAALSASAAADDTFLSGYALHVVVYLAIGTLLIVWLWRMYAQIRALSGEPMRYRRGWVIAAWFVPLANLVVPYQLVKDLVAKSGRPLAGVTLPWWLGFVSSVVLASAASEAYSAEAYTASYALYGLELLARAMSASALIQIVRHLTTAQQDRMPAVQSPRAFLPSQPRI